MDAIDGLQGYLDGDDSTNLPEGSYHLLPGDIRDFLDYGLPEYLDTDCGDLRIASLSDFQQAFPRVSPGFIQQVLMAWKLPVWLVVLAMVFLYGRSERIVFGVFLGMTRHMLAGVDQGTQSAAFLYMLAIDPLLAMAK